MEFKRQPRLRGHSINRLIPNMLTLLALCAGMTSMRFALEGAWDRAAIAIVVAAVLDGLDGRIARVLGAASRFGAELDSLSDFISFGVAPAFIVYLWSLQTAGGFGWALALLFGVCCGLRLARFNTAALSEGVVPAWTKNFFVGVPAPVAGLLALLPIYLGLETESDAFSHAGLNGLVVLVVSGLMVSRIPTLAMKQVRIAPRYVVVVLLGVGAFAAFLISTPWITLSVGAVAYLISIPYAVHLYKKFERESPFPVPPASKDEDDSDES